MQGAPDTAHTALACGRGIVGILPLGQGGNGVQAMNFETSLSWRGPYWYAGRNPRRGHSASAPADPDVCLLDAFERSEAPTATLPAAIIVDLTHVPQSLHQPFSDWLCPIIRSLACEVPFYILSGSQDRPPASLRPTAIVDRCVPDENLLKLISFHQRALMRAEEARIRRRIFGRIRGFATAPHHSGSSGLLVVGLSGRFLEWQGASGHRVDVVGAFDGNMAAEFMTRRAFDAVVIDSTIEDTIDYMQQIRRDPRFAGLPIMSVCEDETEAATFFRHGATDVLLGQNRGDTLNRRIAAAIRMGRRRRLADRMLSESQMWLRQQISNGGLRQDRYLTYLETASKALAARGLDLQEMRLTPDHFQLPARSLEEIAELNGTLLSIADATSRDEDLVCLVKNIGPVAVLKNRTGPEKLQRRINAILAHTAL